MYIFKHLDYFWVGVPAIIIVTMLILYIQILVKRYLGTDTIRKCHEVGGNYLAMVGTFYAVLLGLIVIDAMTRFQQAEKTEVTDLESIHKTLKILVEEVEKLKNK